MVADVLTTLQLFECLPGVNDARLGQSSFAARGPASMPSPRLKTPVWAELLVPFWAAWSVAAWRSLVPVRARNVSLRRGGGRFAGGASRACTLLGLGSWDGRTTPVFLVPDGPHRIAPPARLGVWNVSLEFDVFARTHVYTSLPKTSGRSTRGVSVPPVAIGPDDGVILSHWGSAKPKPAWAARIRASTSGKSVMGKSDWFWFISKCGLLIPTARCLPWY